MPFSSKIACRQKAIQIRAETTVAANLKDENANSNYNLLLVTANHLFYYYVCGVITFWDSWNIGHLLAGMPRAFSQPCIISFFQPFLCPWRPCHRTRLKVWSMKLLKTTCCTLIYYVKELCCCVTYRAYFGRTSCPCRKSWIFLSLSQAIY